MTTLFKYRIRCTTDNIDEYVWSETEPTLCPTNTLHTIGNIDIIDKIGENEITINEGSSSLGGFFRTQGERINIPSNYVILGQTTNNVSIGSTVIDVNQSVIDGVDIDDYIGLNDGTQSGLLGKVICINNNNNQLIVGGSTGSGYIFGVGTNVEDYTTNELFTQKRNIGVLSIYFCTSESNNGDGLEFQVYPNKTIGNITSNVSIGGTIIDVSQTVIDNIKVGFLCRLFDGNVTECMGEVLSIDVINKQITIEKPSLNIFSYTSPTYVKFAVRTGITKDIGPPGPRNPGNDKIGASFIPKNESVKVSYTNFTGGAKKFCFSVSHMY